MPRKIVYVSILNIFLSLNIPLSLACNTSGQEEFKFEFRKGVSYSKNKLKSFFVGGCGRKKVRKFIMIGMGPTYFDHNYKQFQTFNSYIADNKCKVINNPLPEWPTHDDILKRYKNRSTQLKKCISYFIEDSSRRGVTVPRKPSKTCSYKRITRQKYLVNGGLCFFQINRSTLLKVTPVVNPSCLSNSNFDLPGIFGVYVAGDSSGSSTDLELLKKVPLQLINSPQKGQVNKIAWETFPLNLKIKEKRSQVQVSIDSLFSNLCPDEVCEFSSIFGAKFKLMKKISESKNQHIASWHEGGIIPPKYQGFVPGVEQSLKKGPLKIGDQIIVEGNFSFIFSYYKFFKEKFSQFLLTQGSREVDTSSLRLGTIGNMDTLGRNNTLRRIGTYPGIKNINRLPKSLLSLAPFINSTEGGNFTAYCKQNLKDCLNFRNGRFKFKWKMFATLGEKLKPTIQKVTLSNNLNESTEVFQQTELPIYECK